MEEMIDNAKLNKIIKYTDKEKISCIGKRIVKAREELLENITREQLAERINRSTAYVGNRERGEVPIETAFLLAIVHKYGISLEWLVNGTGKEFLNDYSFGVEVLGVDYTLTKFEKEFIQNYVEMPAYFRKNFTRLLNEMQDLVEVEIAMRMKK